MRFIFIFFIYILILIFYSWYNLITVKDNSKLEVKNLFRDKINTGDIFLLSNSKKSKIFGDLIFKLNFFHPSIALWEKNNLFILELASYPGRNGFVKINFEDWLKFNKNKILLHNPLKIKKDNYFHRNKLSKNLSNFYNINQKSINNLDKNINLNWLRFIFRIDKKIEFNNIMCTEIVVKIFKDLDIIKDEKELHYFKPQDFFQMKGFKLNSLYDYSEIYLCNF